MNQEIINLYDEYTHKPLTRQEFMGRLVKLTGGIASALTILTSLEVNYAYAATIQENDEFLVAEDITYDADGVAVKGYLARPKGSVKRGTVLVIHENRGLNPHIKDVARRVAKSGYIALAPDALSPLGGTPANEDEAKNLFSQLDTQKNLNNFLKGLAYLRGRSDSNGKTGAVGFCWGGALVNQQAINDPLLNAAVAFYGRQPKAEDVSRIKAKLLLHYGGLDERVNEGIPAYEAALKAANIPHQLFIYEGVQHAFHNDTAPTRYNEAAAKLAWERTLGLFKETL